jgi:hypothetical protein
VKIRCGAVEVPGTGALEGYSIATAWDPTVGGKAGGGGGEFAENVGCISDFVSILFYM